MTATPLEVFKDRLHRPDGDGDHDSDLRHDEAALADGFRPTDVGNAARLVAAADGKIRYAHEWGKWLVYRDGVWVIDTAEALVTEQAKDVARRLFKQAITLPSNHEVASSILAPGSVVCPSTHRVATPVRVRRRSERHARGAADDVPGRVVWSMWTTLTAR